jgi:putative flippase GtrA
MKHLPYAKIFRFCLVGAANAVIYALSTSIYIAQFGIGDKTASVLGFCTAVPFAFLAHRSFTFSSRGLARDELPRFIVTQLTSLLTSVFAMGAAVDLLGLHYSAGILGSRAGPRRDFLVLNKWVFRHQARTAARFMTRRGD